MPNLGINRRTLTILQEARSQVCLAERPAKSKDNTSASLEDAATRGFYCKGDTNPSNFGDFNNLSGQLLRGEGEEKSRLEFAFHDHVQPCLAETTIFHPKLSFLPFAGAQDALRVASLYVYYQDQQFPFQVKII